MSDIHRIPVDYRLNALVAVDSFPALAERIQRLTPVGRRLTVAHRYATYTGHPAEVYPGLTVAAVRVNPDTCSLWVECALNGSLELGFGIGIRDRWRGESEEKAWGFFHAGRHEADAFEDRRRDLTHVQITGGREVDGLSRDDRLVIRTYNSDGVCDERIVGFEGVL